MLVRPGPSGTELCPLMDPLAKALEDVASEFGLAPGELLLLTRLALFVEGPHDVAVLEEWFGRDLQAAGVRLFPLHGLDNVSYLVDSEVIAALGLKMAALVDNADADKVRRGGEPGSYEEGMVFRLLEEARLSKRPIRAFGLDQHDIVDYLDDAVCKAKAPAFPGWRQAEKAWNRAERPEKFKTWVSQEYQLRLDRESVRALARTCKAEGKIHSEVRCIVQEILHLRGTVGSPRNDEGRQLRRSSNAVRSSRGLNPVDRPDGEGSDGYAQAVTPPARPARRLPGSGPVAAPAKRKSSHS